MNLVNKPLYENSVYTFNHAYYFDLEKLFIVDVNRPQTEYNLSLAIRAIQDLSKNSPLNPVEEIFTGKEYIDTHANKYTKNDLYTKVLPKVLT